MAAVVRVKRPLNEEPSSGLILSCKRRKTDDSGGDAVETLFKFAGTVKDQEENVALLKPDQCMKDDVKKASRPTPNISQKARLETKTSSQLNRFKLVNYFRTIGTPDENDGTEDACQNCITVLDVEAHSSVNDGGSETHQEVHSETVKASKTQDSSPYVYDLYYIQTDSKDLDLDDLLLDGLVSFAPVENELVFDSYRNNRAGGDDSDSDSPHMDDDDDSNDENNWRNDYPDDEEDNSDDDCGLASGLGKITFGDEELSSDGDDEKLIYTEELSPSDVNMYGSAYARFKKKALKELDSNLEINSDSDDSSNQTKSGDSTHDNSDEDNRFE